MKFNTDKISEIFRSGLSELANDYGFGFGDDGMVITCAKSDSLKINKSETGLYIEYSKTSEFYRGFVAALNKPCGFTRTDKASFETLGMMADNSRNAVLNIPSLKRLIRLLASCGYDYFELYTEDTFELEGEPLFGYLRGRFTANEIKELDSYAAIMGIELVPCIQTLAHFNAITRWKTYRSIIDWDNILLIDDPKTYELIDKMFRFAAENFKSRKINIGMDEAYMAGLGRFLRINGYHDRASVLARHLNKILSMADEYGFKCAMWSDMFFRLAFKDIYHNTEETLPKKIMNMIPKNVKLIYWDYIHNAKEEYDHIIHSHKLTGNEVTFAGTAWKHTGFSPLNAVSSARMATAMDSCLANDIKDVLITAWSNDGAECPMFATLPSLVRAAEKSYGNPKYKEAFKDIAGCEFDDFMSLDLPNGFDISRLSSLTSCYGKIFLYNDCLSGIFDGLVVSSFKNYYKIALKTLKPIKEKGCQFGYLFETAYALIDVVALKYDMGVLLRDAYLRNDKSNLRLLAAKMLKIVKKIEVFYEAFRKQWMIENRPTGFEIHDARLGGLIQRIKACHNTILDYCENRISNIYELEQNILPAENSVPGENYNFSSWSKIISTNLLI